ncbi:MAG: radical SAM protein [Candidatus Pacebacteria bacterium]|nr:radical SAM protein [Candidatus Paceibacterota bacterium]
MKSPVIVQLEITNLCNFKCPHCYRFDNHSCLNSQHEKIKHDKIFKISKKLIDLEIFEVVLTGGEPFMEKDLLMELINCFYDHGITVSLNTNLSLLREEFIDSGFLNKLKVLLVSCPSSIPENYKFMTGGGNYEIFKESLKLLNGNFRNYFINMVVNKNNINDIRKTASDLKSLGVKNFGATPMMLNDLEVNKDTILNPGEVKRLVDDLIWVHDNLKMNVDIFEALPKCIFSEETLNRGFKFTKRKCQAGITTISVSPEGNIMPCPNNTMVYGNILKDDFQKVWHKMSNWKKRAYAPKECSECSLLKICFGACRVNAKSVNGTLDSPDPWMSQPLNYQLDSDKINYKWNENDTLSMAGELQYRREDEMYYLIAVKKRNNYVKVNKELFNFLLTLNNGTFYKLIDLAGSKKVFSSNEFQKIINFLLVKKIVILN